ncbi:hypothetical protein C8F04DRAFT_1296060 [Mycena alexandri]|uniref:Uncharacterized protein n=1 Tax=Mycena alexandri TaxID=1745969 RepID=A0AAD6SH74_9AGAR|nr:hypothetical protein C8F04DRAFT_1296060 [Mycena alexandri]
MTARSLCGRRTKEVVHRTLYGATSVTRDWHARQPTPHLTNPRTLPARLRLHARYVLTPALAPSAARRCWVLGKGGEGGEGRGVRTGRAGWRTLRSASAPRWGILFREARGAGGWRACVEYTGTRAREMCRWGWRCFSGGLRVESSRGGGGVRTGLRGVRYRGEVWMHHASHRDTRRGACVRGAGLDVCLRRDPRGCVPGTSGEVDLIGLIARASLLGSAAGAVPAGHDVCCMGRGVEHPCVLGSALVEMCVRCTSARASGVCASARGSRVGAPWCALQYRTTRRTYVGVRPCLGATRVVRETASACSPKCLRGVQEMVVAAAAVDVRTGTMSPWDEVLVSSRVARGACGVHRTLHALEPALGSAYRRGRIGASGCAMRTSGALAHLVACGAGVIVDAETAVVHAVAMSQRRIPDPCSLGSRPGAGSVVAVVCAGVAMALALVCYPPFKTLHEWFYGLRWLNFIDRGGQLAKPIFFIIGRPPVRHEVQARFLEIELEHSSLQGFH